MYLDASTIPCIYRIVVKEDGLVVLNTTRYMSIEEVEKVRAALIDHYGTDSSIEIFPA